LRDLLRRHPAEADRVTIVDEPGDATRLLRDWKSFDSVVVIDAVVSGGEPGRIYMFEGEELADLESSPLESTHSIELKEVVGFGRALGSLPSNLIVYAIEIGHITAARDPSHAVSAAVDEVVEEIGELLGIRVPVPAGDA
jgi:hydrogenase maturation protease